MMDDSKLTFIERMALLPLHLEHKDYNKCGLCLKEVINSEVAKEMVKVGKITNDFLKEYEAETKRRFQDSFLFKEIHRIKNSGKTLNEAIKEMEDKGFIP